MDDVQAALHPPQKSCALIGVLVSVTTLPAASYAGLAAAYWEWEAARESLIQLVTNLVCIFVAWLAILGLQRLLYERRRARHPARALTARRAFGPTRRTSARSADAGVLA